MWSARLVGLRSSYGVSPLPVACGNLPPDPEHTPERVRRDRQIRVGLTEHPLGNRTTGEPAGAEVELVRQFASQMGADRGRPSYIQTFSLFGSRVCRLAVDCGCVQCHSAVRSRSQEASSAKELHDKTLHTSAMLDKGDCWRPCWYRGHCRNCVRVLVV